MICLPYGVITGINLSMVMAISMDTNFEIDLFTFCFMQVAMEFDMQIMYTTTTESHSKKISFTRSRPRFTSSITPLATGNRGTASVGINPFQPVISQ
jgi:hypothetical protein